MDFIITAIFLLFIHSTYGVEVRLVGGTSPLEGRVEVYYNNKWGTICDDYFSTKDAGVICSMLDFERIGARFFIKAYFGEGTGQIWLDDMKCDGNESLIDNCIGSLWGSHNCHHSEDVGVRCRPKLEVRLVGGSHYYEGRIEVLFSGIWGTVCDDFFDDLDAHVLCYMLGFKRDGAVAKTNAYFGPGSGTIWLDDLGCTGTERSVGDCSRAGVLGCHNCNHSEDAGVICRPGKCEALPSVTNGRFSPDTCTTSFRSAGLDCTLICNPGYSPTPQNSTTCFDTGDWSHQISCADIDECHTVESECTQLCSNVEGSYMCSCNDGYQLSSDGKSCIDIDERGTDNCTQQCINIDGSYECTCNDGYKLMSDKRTCADIDECLTDESGCTQLCSNVEGSYMCSCYDGYQLSSDGKSCSDIDECAIGISNCTQECMNIDGSYECTCNDGYKLMSDKRTCEDIDECMTGVSGCTQLCSNVEGSYMCSCKYGYQLSSDGISCIDIDECALGISNCPQQCINIGGSFECKCNDGYKLMPDNRTCAGVKYRIHVQIGERATPPAYIVLDGKVQKGVRLELVSPEKLELGPPKKLKNLTAYNVTGGNVGEIEHISFPNNDVVNVSVSVYNPYINGYYIRRYNSSSRVNCTQFGEDLNKKPNYLTTLSENFRDVKDITDCKLLCIEELGFNFTCKMVHLSATRGCNVLQKADTNDFREDDNIVSKRTDKC